MTDQPIRVLLVSSHPVQYASPLYRLYARDPRLDVTVAYCSLQGAQPGVDPEFGVEVAWDVPLLEGYRWVHPPNRSPRPGLRGFFGLVNPGLATLIWQERPDVVVCYGWRAASFWIAALAATLAGAKLVFTTDAHTLEPRDGRRAKATLKRVLLPLFFRLADAAFGPSSRTLALLRSLGVREDRLFLTHYVVDNQFFAAGAAAADRIGVRRRWGLPEDAFVVLFVGKLVPWKRPADVLEAVARVPGAFVVLAGEGPLRAALEARAAQPDLAGRIRFLGFVNQRALPEVYAAADVLVLPSEYEAFGLVVNEAFCCGLPAIVTEACGAAGDLVRDGETGYIVPVGDVDALADRLRRLAADPDLRRALGAAARSRMDEWGPEQNAHAFADACLTLTGRQSLSTHSSRSAIRSRVSKP
ncbi:MAG: glycosyltransferase family 4 protein [Armatimonadota bacterium]|nr:glycosyltransferase family 4 protein [Armatimonadota bacterium]MDR7544784.1 glycosyltransferase family 4 protein [Armatimonadota bacterium]